MRAKFRRLRLLTENGDTSYARNQELFPARLTHQCPPLGAERNALSNKMQQIH